MNAGFLLCQTRNRQSDAKEMQCNLSVSQSYLDKFVHASKNLQFNTFSTVSYGFYKDQAQFCYSVQELDYDLGVRGDVIQLPARVSEFPPKGPANLLLSGYFVSFPD